MMTDAHRAATAVSSRPPWETPLVGVRCPSCGLGGDIPETIVRTVCPRCSSVFAVAAARAERPTAVRPTVTAPTVVTPPVAAPVPPPVVTLAPIPLPPVPPVEPVVVTARPARPARPVRPARPASTARPAGDDPLTLAGLALIPPRRPERDRHADRPTVAAARSGATRPGRRVRVAAIGATMFAVGVTAGWMFRSDGDAVRTASPAEVREAGADHEVADAARDDSEARSANGPADSDDGQVVGPAAGTASSGAEDRSEAKRSTAKSSSKSADGTKSGSAKSSSSKQSSEKSSGRSSSGASTTTPRDGSTTSRPGATDRDVGSLSSTTLADVTATTVGAAPPAQPSVTLPVVRACSELDCHMTGASGFDRIPIPDDAVAVTTAKGVTGWTTQVGTILELTSWYVDHLTDEGWVLNGPASVMDPLLGEAHELGHSTSAIYCPTDSDDPIVAVNVGWPADDTSGGTVVIGIVGGIDESACN